VEDKNGTLQLIPVVINEDIKNLSLNWLN